MSNHFLVRLQANVNRFGTLRLANRAFRSLTSPTWVSRRLFGRDMHMDLARTSAQKLLFLEGERFVEERHVLRTLLKPGMTVVDVGANIGYYMLLADQCVGPSGRIICVEPSVENLPELRRNIDANALRNVELHEVALGAENGEVGLKTGINSGVAELGQAEHVVPVQRLDALVSDRVDFLKIDVEGYEGQVIEGASRLIETFRPTIFLEMHPHLVGRFGYSVDGVLGMISPHYTKMTFLAKTKRSQSPVGKALSRYLNVNTIKAVPDNQQYLQSLSGDVDLHAFWVVFEP